MIDMDMQNGERTELSDAELDCVVGNFAMSVWATAGAHGVAAANG